MTDDEERIVREHQHNNEIDEVGDGDEREVLHVLFGEVCEADVDQHFQGLPDVHEEAEVHALVGLGVDGEHDP